MSDAHDRLKETLGSMRDALTTYSQTLESLLEILTSYDDPKVDNKEKATGEAEVVKQGSYASVQSSMTGEAEVHKDPHWELTDNDPLD